jgi:hypothetical protein
MRSGYAATKSLPTSWPCGFELSIGTRIIFRQMAANFSMNCIPETMLDCQIKDFSEFLVERRRLMALKIKAWFEIL